MSISSPAVIEDRILSARNNSKIALFGVTDKDGNAAVDAVFAETVITNSRIKLKSSGYLGKFSGKMGAIQAVDVMDEYLGGRGY